MNEANNPLTPELCRTFVTLARLAGSVTATARELGLNEARISKRIRPLVRGAPPHLPRPWLMKRGKRFFLTDEGRAMLPAATEQAQRWRHFTAFAPVG
jgi:DNA-binding transcriptional LysR family regulator